MIFSDGTREPLHGHNYRVQVKGDALELNSDMVFDFLDIKPIVREICDSLDHKLIIPKGNDKLKIFEEEKNFRIECPDESLFSIPKQDVILLPIENTSSERLAIYLSEQIRKATWDKFQFKFKELEVEVEETPGQSAIYVHKEESL